MIAPEERPNEILDYVVKLGRKDFEAIGFLPKPRLEAYHASGQIYVQHENDELCGFLVFGSGWPVLCIYQACIQYDARRREHGASLVARLEANATERGYAAVSLWCAEELEANAFWKGCGFSHIDTKPGGVRRGRLLNRWEKHLSRPLQPMLGMVTR